MKLIENEGKIITTHVVLLDSLFRWIGRSVGSNSKLCSETSWEISTVLWLRENSSVP